MRRHGPAKPIDIFISYASEDRDEAERLAGELTARGWSVWWDREIVPGNHFSEVIEEALSRARCAIVLWSPASVQSDWVQTEASEARSRDILVPAIVEECVIPLEFRRIEAAVIGRRWKSDDVELQLLVSAVAAKLGRPQPVEQPAARRPGWLRRPPLPRWSLIAVVALAGIALVAVLVAVNRSDDDLTEATETTATTTESTGTTRPAPTATTTSSTTTEPGDPTTQPSAVSTSEQRRDPVEVLADDPITEQGIGPIVVGMRADQIQAVLPDGLVVESYDQQGPLVDTEGVTIRRSTGEDVLYALSLPEEGPGLDILIFVDEAFRTAEGVGPGSSIDDATQPYGWATLSFSTAAESREFVDFRYNPYRDISFRVAAVADGFAGIYPEPFDEFNSTTEYRPGASIESVWVVCRQSCPGGA